ncbi:MAG TPA: asparaginase, partial [Longimicrobiales bacterium]|nr:asparaginase [Longimicrobiales bacterium]
MSGARVEVLRGTRVESVHDVDIAVVDGGGRLAAAAGDAEDVIFARSALKPFQALPLVEDGVLDRFGLGEAELALCCASHSGEPRHVEVAARILDRIGRDEEDLACGPHPPFSGDAARALVRDGREPGRIHNNCSGKHGGMLALALAHGWPAAGYQERDHPVQRRMLEEVSRWTGVPEEEVGTAVDGCGVVTFAVPLRALALAFARLAVAPEGSPAARVRGAMIRNPFLVGGSRRLCTRIMEVSDGRILAKVGAEGVYG